jgi:hypothetical protein
VIDVAAGRTVYERPFRIRDGSSAPYVELHPTGRLLSIHAHAGERFMVSLPEGDGLVPTERPPALWGAAGEWAFGQNESAGPNGVTLLVTPVGTGRPWLALPTASLVPWEKAYMVTPSPDSRRVAWSSSNGVVLVADLPALRREVDAFEESLR